MSSTVSHTGQGTPQCQPRARTWRKPQTLSSQPDTQQTGCDREAAGGHWPQNEPLSSGSRVSCYISEKKALSTVTSSTVLVLVCTPRSYFLQEFAEAVAVNKIDGRGAVSSGFLLGVCGKRTSGDE